MLHRAYSLLEVKEFSPTGRTFSGIATTPTPDRVDDVVEPLGIEFKNPMPLHLFHDSRLPVGKVLFGKPSSTGVPFRVLYELGARADIPGGGTAGMATADAFSSLRLFASSSSPFTTASGNSYAPAQSAPEPATLLLFGAGLLAADVRRRRAARRESDR